MHKKYISYLLILLCFKAAFMAFIILYSGIGLGPDEAQYWTWSQHLDWGYYSKPPGIAWQNAFGTYLFGNTEFGVRSMPLLIGSILPLLIYAAARSCQLSPSACFWAATAMAFSPMGMMSSLLSITDGGMILFWTAACAYLAYSIQQAFTPNYLIIGGLVLCGALFKWPMYILWVLIVVMWRAFPSLISWRILPGITLSILALIPSVYWNSSHDWVTFRHVGSTIAGGHAPKAANAITQGNFLEYLGAQALLVFPILFALFLMASWKLLYKKNSANRSAGVTFCALISLLVLGFALILSLFMKIQGNWGIFAFPTAFVVIAWYACDLDFNSAKKWLIGGIILSFLLSALAFSIPFLQSNTTSGNYVFLPYKINPFRHNIGWNALKQELNHAGYDPKKDFLFGDKYQMASILSFYGEGQNKAYFFNLLGTRKNQFSFWPGMDREQLGKRGFFVVTENTPKLNTEAHEIEARYLELLKPYFNHMKFLGIKPLFYVNGEIVKGAFIFECIGFLGKVPKDPDLY